MSIEELLRETLDERATRVRGDDDVAAKVIHRVRGRRGRRVFIGLSALVIVVIVVVLTITWTLPRNGRVSPDPRATAVPSVSPTNGTATGSATTDVTFRVVQGPLPTGSGPGAAIGILPRVELRGSVTWFVAGGVSVALPATVAGSRGIAVTAAGWVISTISSSFTGGDTDAGAQILTVSNTGVVRTLTTGAIRSMAVSPDGTQVADVETTERPLWTVQLVTRRLSDGALVGTVGLSYGSPGSWPYPSLLWTPDGIVASNPFLTTPAPGATVLVHGATITDLAPVLGVFAVPGGADVVEVVQHADRACVRQVASVASPLAAPLAWCGSIETVVPLGDGLILVAPKVTGGAAPQDVWVVDTRASTVTELPVDPALQATNLRTVVALTGTSVLVDDLATGDWLRWDVVKNNVEVAPLPSGAKAAISW